MVFPCILCVLWALFLDILQHFIQGAYCPPGMAEPVTGPAVSGAGDGLGPYLPPLAFLPKRRSNRATRPPVSRIFCLPV